MVIKGSVRQANFVTNLNKDSQLETGNLERDGKKVIQLALHNPTDQQVSLRLFLATE